MSSEKKWWQFWKRKPKREKTTEELIESINDRMEMFERMSR